MLKDFYEFTHVRAGLFDPAGKELIAYPQELSSYCTQIRKTEAGRKACMKSDESAYRHATFNESFYIYTCHAGLSEMVVPIHGQGILLGYLMIGQFRIQRKTGEIINPPVLSPGVLQESYELLPSLNVAQINAALHILQACASYVWMDEYIRIQDSSLGLQIKEYMQNHLNQKIQISDLMNEFHVGKTTICSTVQKVFHMTVTELLRSLRINEAKLLLKSTTLSISDVAALVGVGDYNYFSRIFHRELGITPSEYRKNFNSNPIL